MKIESVTLGSENVNGSEIARHRTIAYWAPKGTRSYTAKVRIPPIYKDGKMSKLGTWRVDYYSGKKEGETPLNP
jgi:hypothetical protein